MNTVKNLAKKVDATLLKLLSSKKNILGYLWAYLVVILTVSIGRWYQFEYYYFDHGIFDQSLWSVAHGQPPLIDHFEKNYFLNQFGDHFTPTLYLLAPIYWFTNSYIPLLFIQNLFVVAAAYVLWLLSQERKVSPYISAALLVAFTGFLGIQNTIIAGFHTEFPALLTLALTFLFAERKNWKWFWIFLILTLGLKETFAPMVVGIGSYLFLEKNYKQGSAVIAFALLYFMTITRVVIPSISGQTYGYSVSELKLQEVVTKFFLPVIKTRTLLVSLLSFGLLPLLSFSTLPLLFQEFFVRFVLTEGGFTWDFGFHYSAMSAVLLYFAAIKGFERIKKHSFYKHYVIAVHALLIVGMIAVFHFKYSGSLGLFYNRAFYQQTQSNAYLQNFIEQIPADGLVMTQNNFAPRLTHTHRVMLLRDTYWRWEPAVIAIDIRQGQNPNNYWPIDTVWLYDKLKKDTNYELHEVTSEQVYFTKKDSFDPNFYYEMGWEKR